MKPIRLFLLSLFCAAGVFGSTPINDARVEGTWTFAPGAIFDATGGVLIGFPGTGTITTVIGDNGAATGLTLSVTNPTNTPTLTLGGILNVANGGTGTAIPSLVAGAGIQITGSYPNQQITNVGAGGLWGNIGGTLSNQTDLWNFLQSLQPLLNVGGAGLIKFDGISVYSPAVLGTDYINANQTITISGDASGSGTTAISLSITGIHGVSFPSSPGTNTVPVVTAPNTITYEKVPNVALANSTMSIAGTSLALGGTLTLDTIIGNGTAISSSGIIKRTGLNTYAIAIPGTDYAIPGGPTFVPVSRSINTTAPLTGGQNLGSDVTLAITQSTVSTDGFLSHTDWNTFNNKLDSNGSAVNLTNIPAAQIVGQIPLSQISISDQPMPGSEPVTVTTVMGDNNWRNLPVSGTLTTINLTGSPDDTRNWESGFSFIVANAPQTIVLQVNGTAMTYRRTSFGGTFTGNFTFTQNNSEIVTIFTKKSGTGGALEYWVSDSVSPPIQTNIDVIAGLEAQNLFGTTGGAPFYDLANAKALSLATGSIANSAVTLAKIANAAANSKLLGSGATGSGSAYTEITLGTNLSMSGTTLNATGGSGSPVGPLTSVQFEDTGVVFNGTLDMTFDKTNRIFGVLPPAQISTAQAGNSFTVKAGDAVAGTTGGTAANGGALTLIAGNGANNTTGNSNGGNIGLQAGVKTASGGDGQIKLGTTSSNWWNFLDGGGSLEEMQPSGSNNTIGDLTHYLANLFTNAEAINLANTAAPTLFTVGETSSSTTRGITDWQSTNDTLSARIQLRKSRFDGTAGHNFSVLSTIVTGDVIGNIVAQPYDGTSFLDLPSFRVTSVGTIATTSIPTKVEILTSSTATPSVATPALTLDQSQNATFAGKIISYGGSAPTDGQILIGDTAGGNLQLATITAGANITITNAGHSITIASSGGGGGTPGGSNTQFQYNNAGAFGGVTGVTSNGTTMTVAAGDLNLTDALFTNEAAPSTPAAGKTIAYIDSTSKNIAAKNDAGTVNHGVQTQSASAGTFIEGISDAGAVTTGTAVTSIATTSPISGGSITGTGTISLLTNVDFSFTHAQTDKVTDAGTSTNTDIVTLSHDSSNTPVANFAGGIALQLQDSTTADQDAGRLTWLWTSATHASHASALDVQLSTGGAASASVARFFGSGGFSVNASADPGAGIINANSGFRIGNAAGNGKVMKGNGTNFVASTETYAAPGTSGNVMQSDGTNWTSAAPAWTVAQGGTGAATLTGLVLGNGTSAFTTVTAPSGTVVGTSDTQTLTNKRNTKRVTAVTFNATPTFNTDNADEFTFATTAAITNMTTNMTGSPNEGDNKIFRFKDDNGGSAPYAITWGTGFAASSNTAYAQLPTTTTKNKYLYCTFIYNSTAAQWLLTGVSDGY